MDDILLDEPLKEFFVDWFNCPPAYAKAFKRCLSKASTERELQKFLSAHPTLLALQLAGGHGRWVIPQKRLGNQYVTDFMIAEKSTVGFEWYAVELKSPKVKMFTKAGNPTHQLTHAIAQIQRCRNWLHQNQNYASRTENGLGLTDISAALPGLILIGRRADNDDSTNGLRRQMAYEHRIKIHSYDHLLDSQGALSVLPKRIV
jgi:hypothetical protein